MSDEESTDYTDGFDNEDDTQYEGGGWGDESHDEGEEEGGETDDEEQAKERELLERHGEDIRHLGRGQGTQNIRILEGELRRTRPIMTNYEEARILGIRATEIEQGSEPLVPIDVRPGQLPNPIDIAREELRQGLLGHLVVLRPIPGGASRIYERFSATELRPFGGF